MDNIDLNEYIDKVYIKYLYESHGISTQLIEIQYNICNLIKPLVYNQKQIKLYTGYNWDFNKDTLVRVDDDTKPYPLYINLCKYKISSKQEETYRNLNKEKMEIHL